MMMSDENRIMRPDRQLSVHAEAQGGYAELCRRRSHIESDIAHQEVRVAEVLSRLVSPKNVAALFSPIKMDRMRSGFVLFRWANRLWQWWSFMRRFAQRFL